MASSGMPRQEEGGNVAGWSENDDDGLQLLGLMMGNAQQRKQPAQPAKSQPTAREGKAPPGQQHRLLEREPRVRPSERLDAEDRTGLPSDAVQHHAVASAALLRAGITGSKGGQGFVPARMTTIREARQRDSPAEKKPVNPLVLQHMSVLHNELEKELRVHQTFPAARLPQQRRIHVKPKKSSGLRSSSALELDRLVPALETQFLSIGFNGPIVPIQQRGNVTVTRNDQLIASRPMTTNSVHRGTRRAHGAVPSRPHMEVISGRKESGFASGFSHQGSGRDRGGNYTTVDAISPRPKHVRSLQGKKDLAGSELPENVIESLREDVIVSQLPTLKKPESTLRMTSSSDSLRADDKEQVHAQADASSTRPSNLGPFMEHGEVGMQISIQQRTRSQGNEPFRPKSASAVPGSKRWTPITPGKEPTPRPLSAAADTISDGRSESEVRPRSRSPSPLMRRQSPSSETRITQRKGSAENFTANKPSSAISRRSSSPGSVEDRQAENRPTENCQRSVSPTSTSHRNTVRSRSSSIVNSRTMSAVSKASSEFSELKSVGYENSFQSMFGAFGGSVPPSIPPHNAGVDDEASIKSDCVTIRKCPRVPASARGGRKTKVRDGNRSASAHQQHHDQHLDQHLDQHRADQGSGDLDQYLDQHDQYLDQHEQYAVTFRDEDDQYQDAMQRSATAVPAASDYSMEWPFELPSFGDRGRRGRVSAVEAGAGEAMGLHADAGFKVHFEDMLLQPQLKSILARHPDDLVRLRRQAKVKPPDRSRTASPKGPPAFGNWPGAGVTPAGRWRPPRKEAAEAPVQESLSHFGEGPRPVRAQLYYLAGAPNDHLDVSDLEESLSAEGEGRFSPGHPQLHDHPSPDLDGRTRSVSESVIASEGRESLDSRRSQQSSAQPSPDPPPAHLWPPSPLPDRDHAASREQRDREHPALQQLRLRGSHAVSPDLGRYIHLVKPTAKGLVTGGSSLKDANLAAVGNGLTGKSRVEMQRHLIIKVAGAGGHSVPSEQVEGWQTYHPEPQPSTLDPQAGP